MLACAESVAAVPRTVVSIWDHVDTSLCPGGLRPGFGYRPASARTEDKLGAQVDGVITKRSRLAKHTWLPVNTGPSQNTGPASLEFYRRLFTTGFHRFLI